MMQLLAAGDPLHLMAAEALVSLHATAEPLQERVYQARGDRPPERRNDPRHAAGRC